MKTTTVDSAISGNYTVSLNARYTTLLSPLHGSRRHSLINLHVIAYYTRKRDKQALP